MTALDTTDIVVLVIILVCTVVLFWNVFQSKTKSIPSSSAQSKVTATSAQPGKVSVTNTSTIITNKKSIVSKVESIEDECIIILFYGSQTGTAEDFASRFSKDVQSKYGIRSIVCDLEDYDMTELKNWNEQTRVAQRKCIFGFFLATYGEGEPTDNAVDFFNWLSKEAGEDQDVELIDAGGIFSKLNFIMFGLGNRTYEHFNAVARRVDKMLRANGAIRIGHRGEGDDDKSIEEDFLAWKETCLPLVAEVMNVQKLDATLDKDAPHMPIFNIKQHESIPPSKIFLGSHSSHGPRRWRCDGSTFEELGKKEVYDIKHPAYGPIHSSRNLFDAVYDVFKPKHGCLGLPNLPNKYEVKNKELWITRQCLHLEVDISATGLTYETGDHIGVWPANSRNNVERLAGLLKIQDLDEIIDLVPNPSHPASVDTKKPVPTPCTIRSALTYYLDIQHVIKQHHFEILAKYASDAQEKVDLWNIHASRDTYIQLIESQRKSLADILSDFKSISLPLSVVLTEIIPHTTLRYYSISSSSLERPNSVSITAVVVRYAVETSSARSGNGQKYRTSIREGFATSWLQRIHDREIESEHRVEGEAGIIAVPPTYVPFYIRTSSFKLPKDPKTPIVMVGPGTGLAPFRGFLRERMLRAKRGEQVGPTWLFYGCRHQSKDFLYREELTGMTEAVINGSVHFDLRIITAFSRDGPQKVYVQHRLVEYGDDIWRLLHNNNGFFYVCGDAKNMAHDVSTALENLASKHLNVDENGAKDWVRKLRNSGRYLEDVWA